MAAQWYCQKMGSELGPFSQEHLIDMVRQRQISPEDLVRCNDGKWQAAFEVNGLIEAASKPVEMLQAEVIETPASARDPAATSDQILRIDAGKPATAGSQSVPSSQADWFCIASGVKHGPTTLDELQALAKQGKLRDKDRVWRTSQPKFRTASTVSELHPS